MPYTETARPPRVSYTQIRLKGECTLPPIALELSKPGNFWLIESVATSPAQSQEGPEQESDLPLSPGDYIFLQVITRLPSSGLCG
jgi:hypothetical protein